ncbi:MAG: class I SAM-dependent methyltransferase [Bacilli bacterium]|nr:class I SAM-dependent methyltransferase [Bacilli bacterium]
MNHYFTDNSDLKSELKNIVYHYNDYTFNFTSDNGVFCKDRIDFGSDLLVKAYLKNARNNLDILDVGCGYGFMGLVIAKLTNSHVDLIDINKRALHLCEMNIKSLKVDANCFYSNIYENVSNKYDVIITNPPIRAGKKVVYGILKEALNHMKPNGELWFVIRKNQGALSAIKDISDLYDCTVVDKAKGFLIICAKSR